MEEQLAEVLELHRKALHRHVLFLQQVKTKLQLNPAAEPLISKCLRDAQAMTQHCADVKSSVFSTGLKRHFNEDEMQSAKRQRLDQSAPQLEPGRLPHLAKRSKSGNPEIIEISDDSDGTQREVEAGAHPVRKVDTGWNDPPIPDVVMAEPDLSSLSDVSDTESEADPDLDEEEPEYYDDSEYPRRNPYVGGPFYYTGVELGGERLFSDKERPIALSMIWDEHDYHAVREMNSNIQDARDEQDAKDGERAEELAEREERIAEREERMADRAERKRAKLEREERQRKKQRRATEETQRQREQAVEVGVTSNEIQGQHDTFDKLVLLRLQEKEDEIRRQQEKGNKRKRDDGDPDETFSHRTTHFQGPEVAGRASQEETVGSKAHEAIFADAQHAASSSESNKRARHF